MYQHTSSSLFWSYICTVNIHSKVNLLLYYFTLLPAILYSIAGLQVRCQCSNHIYFTSAYFPRLFDENITHNNSDN